MPETITFEPAIKPAVAVATLHDPAEPAALAATPNQDWADTLTLYGSPSTFAVGIAIVTGDEAVKRQPAEHTVQTVGQLAGGK